MARTGFGQTARQLAKDVAEGIITQAEAERALELAPGQRLLSTGVIDGSGTDRDIPRFGNDS